MKSMTVTAYDVIITAGKSHKHFNRNFSGWLGFSEMFSKWNHWGLLEWCFGFSVSYPKYPRGIPASTAGKSLNENNPSNLQASSHNYQCNETDATNNVVLYTGHVISRTHTMVPYWITGNDSHKPKHRHLNDTQAEAILQVLVLQTGLIKNT